MGFIIAYHIAGLFRYHLPSEHVSIGAAMNMRTALPAYITENIKVENGNLWIFNLDNLNEERARELYAMSYAFSFARQCGMVWDESNLEEARTFAAHVLIPDYASPRGMHDIRLMPSDEITARYKVTMELARYRRATGRKGTITRLNHEEVRCLRKIFYCDS